MGFFNLNTLLGEVVLVKVCYPTSETPNLTQLNLGDNLSKVRKELEVRGFINDKLAFSRKDVEMSKVSNPDEETIRLKEIIDQNCKDYILYLTHSNLWEYLNEKHKLDYGRTITNDGIKTKDYKVFIMKGCDLFNLGTKEFRSDTVEYNSIETEDRLTKSNFNVNSTFQSFIKLGLSAEIMNKNKSKLETNSTCHYRNYGKFSLKINIRNHLIPTEEFLERVNDAIKSKNSKSFIQIIEDFGQFIPTEVILGGRIYLKDYGSSTENSTEKANNVAMNLRAPNIADAGASIGTNHTIGNSKDYKSKCVEFIGGKLEGIENFDEIAWVKSLEDYKNWECVEFRNPTNIFQLLSDDLQRKIFVLLGKQIIYSKTETYNYSFGESNKPAIIVLRDVNISKTLQNKDADCNIFATVVDEEDTNNECFNCQIFWPQDDEPRLFIHCIQDKFRNRPCKLKISWMVIGYDVNFNSLVSGFDVQLKVLKHDFNTTNNQPMMNKILPIKGVPPCMGIPVLNRLDSPNDHSLIIGHHFYNVQGRNALCAFAYCLKNKRYVNLPDFTFYTLFSNAYESLALKIRKRDFILNRNPFANIEELTSKYPNPTYASLYLPNNNNYYPMFLNQRCKQIQLEYVKCSCNKTCSICNKQFTKISLHDKIECIFFNPNSSNNLQLSALNSEWLDEKVLQIPARKYYGIARINIIEAKDLKPTDLWFVGSDPDSYVKITNAFSGVEYDKTRIIYNSIKPNWQQVIYIPINDLNEQFMLQVYNNNASFKHKLLGYYVLDLMDFMEVRNGNIEGKHLDLECNLTLNGKLHFTADFYSFSELESEPSNIISKNTITINHLYLLITYQRQNGCFEINDDVASLFNFPSKEELIKSFAAFVQNDEVVKKLHIDVWGSAVITAFLKALLCTHWQEWSTVYEKTETYLSETVTNPEIKERLYSLSNKFVIKHFKIESKTSVETVKKVISTQKQDGSFDLPEDVCKQVDVTNESLITTVKNYAVSESLQKTISNQSWWSTALTLSYLKTYASAHEETWKVVYTKARKYLHEQVKDDKLEEEIHKTCSKILIQKTTEKVKQNHSLITDLELCNSQKKKIMEVQSSTTTEKIQSVITKQTVDGSFELSKEDKLDVPSDTTLVSNIQTYASHEKMKKKPESTIWYTPPITIRYLNESQEIQWKDKYQPKKYISKKLGDEILEEEIIKTSDKIVIEKTSLQTKEKNTEKRAALATIQLMTNEELTKTVISTQDEKDGSFGLSEVICKDLDVSSGTLTTIAKKYVTSEKFKDIDNPKVFNTAVTIAYLQITSPAYESQWKDKYEKARKYIKEQINDEILEVELLKASQKLVVEKTTKKVIREEKKSEISDQIVVEPATMKIIKEKKTNQVVTVTIDEVDKVNKTQNNDGSFEASETITEGLVIAPQKDIIYSEKVLLESEEKSFPEPVHEKPNNNSELSTEQQMIQQLKLNHGLFLDEYGIQPSKLAIFKDDGKLNISPYNEQPIVYTNINDPNSTTNLDFALQSSDACINFPIAVIAYNGVLCESFANDDENLNESFGHLYARKVSVGGKLFIKGFSSATPTQIDVIKFYLSCVYNLAKHYNTFSPLNNFFVFDFLRMETLDGKELDTPVKLAEWMRDLYQNNDIDIISYDNLIPIAQLKHELLSDVNIESSSIEKQPGVANFKEKLSFEDWTRNVMDVNLVRWIKDFPQCLVINKSYKLESSKKFAANFVKIPNVKLSTKSYLEVIKPTTKVEEELIINNIFSIKDLSLSPFVDRTIESDDSSYYEYSFLVKLEKYEILMNRDHVKPSIEFEKAINDALESTKPFKALQGVFEEYGHLFAQKIILGKIFKRNIPNATSGKIDLQSPIVESLEPYLNSLNIPYLLTQQGNIIEKNDFFDLIQHLNDLEIIELDDIIPLYKILDEQMQRKIDIILDSNDCNSSLESISV
ncbi:14482_t:CDS:2 [Funneliformis geosporum]|uniref:15826_t:CDS:1 n=1 Tax=Funneliformis geosporum TaxID=1117311 RepID=A0A9W4SHY4_9GLOM|nr:15826_t:CDS:2 [Funneliformis geosporum]CAI2175002.1 14482_t:CDS:2 [Funneliformis geosporum]